MNPGLVQHIEALHPTIRPRRHIPRGNRIIIRRHERGFERVGGLVLATERAVALDATVVAVGEAVPADWCKPGDVVLVASDVGIEVPDGLGHTDVIIRIDDIESIVDYTNLEGDHGNG